MSLDIRLSDIRQGKYKTRTIFNRISEQSDSTAFLIFIKNLLRHKTKEVARQEAFSY